MYVCQAQRGCELFSTLEAARRWLSESGGGSIWHDSDVISIQGNIITHHASAAPIYGDVNYLYTSLRPSNWSR